MISKVVSAIQSNLLVCFPTETVYALACNALNSEAIEEIYKVKKRSQNKPLSIFVSSVCDLMKIAEVKKEYISLVNHFSPGPITYILPLKNGVLPSKFFKNSIGIRIPNHWTAISILNQLKAQIIATSINISGEKSVCRAGDIPQDIRQHLSAVIEDDELVSGMESTIIDLTKDEIRIIRKGKISLQTINNVLRRENEKSYRSYSSQKEING
ncbi:L-threonylcarbamoyladenylate synthase [Wolbachia endosymbiont of Ctenocephalides felis wCfeT]|uniref:L-threonylcarbamoyladenylate synthase n=1 Tax=Wolbachia endosymbiont of Ctenocephalides felis wCfeT TaxID=2732593 RepID=UPI001447EA5E|nr:L-threonylcarbamoyladenylate synthase [Wolbachia endosymbiont of Ctenocephalides felis wCfeT]